MAMGMGGKGGMGMDMGAGGKGSGSMPGDWICPHCGDLQFARNQSCRKCQAPRDYQQTSLAGKGLTGNEVFDGIIKNYDEEKGWGHIQCEVTRGMFGKDIFMMR